MWKRPDRDDPTGAACVIDSGGSSGRRRMGCRKQPANKRPVRLKRSKGCIKRPVRLKRSEGCIARGTKNERNKERNGDSTPGPPILGMNSDRARVDAFINIAHHRREHSALGEAAVPAPRSSDAKHYRSSGHACHERDVNRTPPATWVVARSERERRNANVPRVDRE